MSVDSLRWGAAVFLRPIESLNGPVYLPPVKNCYETRIMPVRCYMQ
jgi:hypothetical protein